MRHIGIQHRRKRTATGEARPTRVCIIDRNGERTSCELESDTDELDFLLQRFPVKYRAVEEGDDLSQFPAHHIKWRKAKKDEDLSQIPENHRKVDGKLVYIVSKVPTEFTGLQAGDIVGMVLGGSGDRLAYALSRRGEEIGAKVCRLPPFALKEWRETLLKNDKDDDAGLLAELVQQNSEAFQLATGRDRQLIKLTEAYRARMEAMKARVGCEQRLHQHLVGLIFCSEEGKYPEGTIEAIYEKEKDNDKVLQGFVAEEKRRDREMAKVLEGLPVYTSIFQPIAGVGPAIAARLIVAIRDIRRFSSEAKLKAYLGAHVMNGGKYGERPKDKQFVRRRSGEVANWQADGRQALYLLVDQFNRRPDSEWGKKLREIKANLQKSHPDVMCKECSCTWDNCQEQKSHTRKYTPGHIQKMVLWKTATKFVERLWKDWTRLERAQVAKPNEVASEPMVQVA